MGRYLVFALYWYCIATQCDAAVILKIGDVSVQQQSTPQIVAIPFFGFADAPVNGSITVAGFNLNVEIGNDGGGVLPPGIDFEFPFPNNGNLSSGGETQQVGWSPLTTIDAKQPIAPGNPQPILPLSDVYIVGNAAIDNQITLSGNTSDLTGGTLLFNLNIRIHPSATGVIPFQFYAELNDQLPHFNALLKQSGNQSVELPVDFRPGSLTIVAAVPEPCSLFLLSSSLVCIGWQWRKCQATSVIEKRR